MILPSKTQTLLIYLEDCGPTRLRDIDIYPIKELRGVVGKLDADKFVIISGKERAVTLTEKGRAELDRCLEYIHHRADKNYPYQVVAFSLPEQKRSLRDKIRRIVNDFGGQRIAAGTWIGGRVNLPALQQELIKQKLDHYVVLLNASLFHGPIANSGDQPWQKFITSTRSVLSQSRPSSFEIKKHIFHYCLLLKNYPFPSQSQLRKGEAVYRELRSRL